MGSYSHPSFASKVDGLDHLGLVSTRARQEIKGMIWHLISCDRVSLKKKGPLKYNYFS